MKLVLKLGLFNLSVALCLYACSSSKSKLPKSTKYVGKWHSAQIEEIGDRLYAWREVLIEENSITEKTTYHLNNQKTFPVYSTISKFQFELGVKSNLNNVMRIQNIRKNVTHRELILENDTEVLINGFGLSQCGLILHQPKDLKNLHCKRAEELNKYSIFYDIITLDGSGNLYFGLVPKDQNQSTELLRPSKLGFPLVRD